MVLKKDKGDWLLTIAIAICIIFLNDEQDGRNYD